jgi:hypothetical protein
LALNTSLSKGERGPCGVPRVTGRWPGHVIWAVPAKGPRSTGLAPNLRRQTAHVRLPTDINVRPPNTHQCPPSDRQECLSSALGEGPSGSLSHVNETLPLLRPASHSPPRRRERARRPSYCTAAPQTRTFSVSGPRPKHGALHKAHGRWPVGLGSARAQSDHRAALARKSEPADVPCRRDACPTAGQCLHHKTGPQCPDCSRSSRERRWPRRPERCCLWWLRQKSAVGPARQPIPLRWTSRDSQGPKTTKSTAVCNCPNAAKG